VAREQTLQRVLAPALADYDVILIDCQPSLGLLTVNALTASDGVIVPLECEYFALRGVALLKTTIDKVQERLNPKLEIDGVLGTMYDGRTLHSREVMDRLVVMTDEHQVIYWTGYFKVSREEIEAAVNEVGTSVDDAQGRYMELVQRGVIDYFGVNTPPAGPRPRVGDTAVYAIGGPQMYVTRCYVAAVTGIADRQPVLAGLFDCAANDVRFEGGHLLQEFNSSDGHRVNDYALSADGRTLTMQVTETSPRLSAPIKYKQVYRRVT